MANRPAGTYEVDPVSRIEGHLGIKVTTDGAGTGATITNAKAHGNLWRGFENFLLGRAANDAITFVQRICGVCPVPHGMTSTYAVDTVLGYSAGHITFAYDGTNGVPKKAVAIRNLVLGMEFLMSSITHFYHLAAPSYIQGPAIPPWTPYFADSNYSNLDATKSMLSGGRAVPQIDADGFSHDLWSTVIRSYVVALRVRRLTFEAGALFAGRMPMTSVYIGGGVTFDGTEDLTPRLDMFDNLAKEVGLFVIQEYVPIALALGLLYPDYDNVHNDATTGLATGTGKGYGGGLGRYLAWGAFPGLGTGATPDLHLPGGLKDLNTPANDFAVHNKAEVANFFLTGGTNSVPTNLTEDISTSRYDIDPLDTAAYAPTVPKPSATNAFPGNVSRTKPNRGKSGAYTYMKAPRWNGLACEVGPMARMFVAGLFVDNQKLAEPTGALYPFYAQYVKVRSAVAGLDPAMIAPDIAVALVKAGLAILNCSAGAVNAAIINGLPPATAHATIVSLYTEPTANITGAIADWVLGMKAGKSTMDRLRARAIESLYLVQQILGSYNKPAAYGGTGVWGGVGSTIPTGWSAELRALTGTALLDVVGSTWRQKAIPTGTVSGWGGNEAPRGALMHTITITAGKITKYQCIVPTTWNGSPCVGPDTVFQNHGAIEAAVIGAPFADAVKAVTSANGGGTPVGFNANSGVEVLRIAQSFDPCIACAIH
jgi:Ni,Fe-hydrogenase I large subunit